jgi:hypothetical protein
MAMTLQDILASRANIYNPQRDLINQQIAQLDPQQQVATQGLEVAKQTAFGDINNAANARGLAYSGAPIAEQQRYVGEKYLPALANLQNTYAGNKSKLQAALLGINQDEMTSAQQLQQQQQKDEADAAYKQQQLAISQQKANSKTQKPSNRDIQTAFNQDLMAAYQQINSGAIKYHPFIREQVAQQLASEYGIPLDQTQKQVNTLFTDSWDNGQRGVKG